MKRLTTLFFLLVSLSAYGQNYIYKGDQRFESTPTWTFTLNKTSHYKTETIDISIGKHGAAGWLLVEYDMTTLGLDVEIAGSFILFLVDGTRITCSDKQIRDLVDRKALSLYYLTPAEIDKLKNTGIQTIRFSLRTTYIGGISLGAFTAENYYTVEVYRGFDKFKDRITNDTAGDISELFK